MWRTSKGSSVNASSIVDNPNLGSGSPAILVVEDEVLVRMMIADEVRMQGFRVFEAATAEEALALLRTGIPVDLILTDIRMPGATDGLALAELARSTWPALKIIIATGQSVQPSRMAVADAVFGKPYDPDRVVQRIRDLLDIQT